MLYHNFIRKERNRSAIDCIVSHLQKLGHTDFRVYLDSDEDGYITVETEDYLPESTIASLQDFLPMGSSYHFYRIPSWAKKDKCFCFGPPSKDCPIHGM